MKRREIIQSIAATGSVHAIGTILTGWRKVFARQPIAEEQPTTKHQCSIDLSQYIKVFVPSYLTQGERIIAYRLDLFTPKRTNNLFHDRNFRVIME